MLATDSYAHLGCATGHTKHLPTWRDFLPVVPWSPTSEFPGNFSQTKALTWFLLQLWVGPRNLHVHMQMRGTCEFGTHLSRMAVAGRWCLGLGRSGVGLLRALQGRASSRVGVCVESAWPRGLDILFPDLSQARPQALALHQERQAFRTQAGETARGCKCRRGFW